jgi:alanine racemase
VKANGYGHGAAAVTEQLVAAGVDTIWTGSYAEAVATKRAVGAEDVKVLMFAGGVPAGMEALLVEGRRREVRPEREVVAAGGRHRAFVDA